MSEALNATPLDLSSVLGTLPGVITEDKRIQDALEQDKKKRKEENDKGKK
jgi:hypothetical protein